jgi:formylglycine-generating enzyme required for sulfatase activity
MFKKTLKYLVVITTSILLVSVSIDAADHYGDYSQSVLSRLVGGQAKGPCPDDMVFVPTEDKGFCIDKYEDSTNESCLHPAPASQYETTDNLSQVDCQPISLEGRLPWVNLSQAQAIEACARAGKRLPTAEEWYLASLGTPDQNEGWTADDCQVSNNWPTQPGQTGSGKNCRSAAGAYDMVGNVWELVKAESIDGVVGVNKLPEPGYISAVDSHGLPVATDPQTPDVNYNKDYLWVKNGGVRSMARGGYWGSKSEAGRYAVYLETQIESASGGIGFRCAK